MLEISLVGIFPRKVKFPFFTDRHVTSTLARFGGLQSASKAPQVTEPTL